MNLADNGGAAHEAVIKSAQAELVAAVAETENGIFRILDAVTRITASLDGRGARMPSAVRGECTTILEACSFQDIVGQRLVKIGRLLASLAPAGANSATPRALEPLPATSGDGLLNGPSLAGEGLSQDEIEKLFDAPLQSQGNG